MQFQKSYLLLLSIIIFALFTNISEANAMGSDFLTEEITQEDQGVFLSSFDLVPLTTEPVKTGILCFDVNEKGMVAIGQQGTSGKAVCIYTSDGTFLYGFAFDCDQSFAIEWDNELINLYFVRSDIIISLDKGCNILDIQKVQDTVDNNSHRNDLLYSTNRIIGDTTYQIRNDMGIFNWVATSYSKMVAVDATGVECTIYDASPTQIPNSVALFVVILLLISVVATIVVWCLKVHRT